MKIEAFSHPEQIWPTSGPARVSFNHVLHDNPLSVQQYVFLSLKKNTFSLLFVFSYQSSEAFDSKAKEKAKHMRPNDALHR